MTELTGHEHAAAQPSPDWPQAADAGTTDPAVARAMARLDALPGLPVAEHEAAYTALHDELLAVLNDESVDGVREDAPGGRPAGAPATEGNS